MLKLNNYNRFAA